MLRSTDTQTARVRQTLDRMGTTHVKLTDQEQELADEILNEQPSLFGEPTADEISMVRAVASETADLPLDVAVRLTTEIRITRAFTAMKLCGVDRELIERN